MELSRKRELQIVSGVVGLVVIALAVEYTQFLPPPIGPFLSVLAGLVAYRAVDALLDFVFGPDTTTIPTGVDPMPRLDYEDAVRKRIEVMISTPEAKIDFQNYPNTLSFIRGLHLLEKKDIERKKHDGSLQLLSDKVHNIEHLESDPRVEQMMNDAVEMMEIPQGAERWGLTFPEREPAPSFTTTLSDSRLAALRGGYASILIHLYSFEHWLDILKDHWTPVQSREEFLRENPIKDKDVFGRDLSPKQYMKEMARREQDYDNRVGISKIVREFALGIDKMKGSIEPAFNRAFPNELQEVRKTADSYIQGSTQLDESMGLVGVFSLATAQTRTFRESSLVISEIEQLRKVFSKDESVMFFLNNLKEEHKFMMNRLREIATSKDMGSPF